MQVGLHSLWAPTLFLGLRHRIFGDAPHTWPVCLVCAGTEWLVPKSPVAFHTLGLGLLPVCIHSFSALRCSIPSGSVCLRCVGGDDDHDHHHRRTQKAAIIAFGKAMRAEATIPPFPSLGKGRGDGWPSRHQRRSCRSTLMAASPQPSLAPMKAGAEEGRRAAICRSRCTAGLLLLARVGQR